MKVQISKWGNSAAVRLPKTILDELKVGPGHQLDLVVEGGEVRLRPARRYPRITLADILAEMDRLGPENRPETVEWGPDRGAEIIEDEYSRR